MITLSRKVTDNWLRLLCLFVASFLSNFLSVSPPPTPPSPFKPPCYCLFFSATSVQSVHFFRRFWLGFLYPSAEHSDSVHAYKSVEYLLCALQGKIVGIFSINGRRLSRKKVFALKDIAFSKYVLFRRICSVTCLKPFVRLNVLRGLDVFKGREIQATVGSKAIFHGQMYCTLEGAQF